jgi:hypothetical protein
VLSQVEIVQFNSPVNAPRPAAIPVKKTGYGLLSRAQDQGFVVQAVPGSPAARAGVPTDRLSRLLEVNGRSIQETESQDSDDLAATVTKLLQSPPPLNLTIQTSGRAVSKVQISHEGVFVYSGPPAVPQYVAEKGVALIFKSWSRQSSFVVVEAASRGEKPGGGKGAPGDRPETINGQQVTLFGRDRPSAHFVRGGVQYLVDNGLHALSEQEVDQVVGSLIPSSERQS